MVDYTKPQYRDATWNIWKGGKKLADELRAFYTNKRVFDRLAASNPAGPTQAAASPTACKGCAKRRMWLKSRMADLALRTGRSPLHMRRELRSLNQSLNSKTNGGN